MKKILASIAALAMAATMATSAFAATTLTGADEYCGDWSATNFLGDEGTLLTYVDNTYLADYLETGCSLTFEFEYYQIAGKYKDYYLFGICDQSWAKLYATDTSFFDGVASEEEGRVEINGAAKTYEDGTPMYKYFMQNDGYVVINPAADGSWTTDTITVNLTADCLQYLVDNASVGDDGVTPYGGLVFQTFGVDVKSLTIDAPKDLSDKAMNADPNGGSEDAGDDNAADDNADTGATAGLALAGIALAAAAVVATKKNK